jgi:hypothetical protein
LKIILKNRLKESQLDLILTCGIEELGETHILLHSTDFSNIISESMVSSISKQERTDGWRQMAKLTLSNKISKYMGKMKMNLIELILGRKNATQGNIKHETSEEPTKKVKREISIVR